MSASPGFLGELKRRKVVRVAVVYAATAFAVLEAAARASTLPGAAGELPGVGGGADQ